MHSILYMTVNGTLLEYIKRNLEKGYSPASLRKALDDAGWKEKDIDDAFMAVSKTGKQDKSQKGKPDRDATKTKPKEIEEKKTNKPKPAATHTEAGSDKKGIVRKIKDKVKKALVPKYSSEYLETDADLLYKMVIGKGSLKVSDASKKLKVPEQKVVEWGEIMEDHGLCKTHYPPIGSPVLLSLEYIKNKEKNKKARKEKKADKKKEKHKPKKKKHRKEKKKTRSKKQRKRKKR